MAIQHFYQAMTVKTNIVKIDNREYVVAEQATVGVAAKSLGTKVINRVVVRVLNNYKKKSSS